MKLYYSPADTGISPADQARFDSFVADYQAHGNGSIAVSAPAGINSQAMIGFFAQRINDMGVPKDHILVATHDAPDGDMRVEINYVSYQAHTDKCGDWSEDLGLHRRQSARPRISAAPCSRISPPRSPIRATCWGRAPWTTPAPRAAPP